MPHLVVAIDRQANAYCRTSARLLEILSAVTAEVVDSYATGCECVTRRSADGQSGIVYHPAQRGESY